MIHHSFFLSLLLPLSHKSEVSFFYFHCLHFPIHHYFFIYFVYPHISPNNLNPLFLWYTSFPSFLSIFIHLYFRLTNRSFFSQHVHTISIYTLSFFLLYALFLNCILLLILYWLILSYPITLDCTRPP